METSIIKQKKGILTVLVVLFFLITCFAGRAQNGVGINTVTPQSNFEVNGSVGQTVTTVTASTTLDATQSIVICNNGATAITITLPDVTLCSGRIYNIKKNATSTSNITINGTIDGVSNLILKNAGEAVTLFSNGTEWKTMSNYNSPSDWKVTGNAGTDSTINFIGTTDAEALALKTNGSTRVNISSNGVTTIGGTTNHIKIEADGTIVMEGTATIFDDLRVTLDKGANSALLDYLSGSSGPQIWFFRNNAAVEAMSFTVQLPHSWKEGTTIYPHLHWIPKNTAGGNVEWNFEYTWANYEAATPQVFPAITTSTVVASGPFTASTSLITALTTSNAGIVATGKKISSILVCRIWRDASRAADTYAADAGLLFLDFHIEMDTFGSRSEFVK